jgi:CBS domain-containing protein
LKPVRRPGEAVDPIAGQPAASWKGFGMNTEAIEILLKIEPFALLPGDVVDAVARQVALMTFPDGAVLAEQGRTTLEQIYIVRSGKLELFFESHGERSLRGMLNPGDVFGGISILMNAGLAIRSLVVVSEASLYVLPKQVFLDCCQRHSSFQDYFISAFNRRMQDESYGAAIATSQVVYFLSKIIPFSFLEEEEVKTIAPSITAVHHPKDTLVFVQGESRVDGLYIVQQGAAERYFEEKDRKTLHSILGEGEMFGGISLLVNDMLAVRTLRTIEDTTFYKLPHHLFFDLCRRYEAFSEYFTDTFGKRMLDRSYAAVIAKSAPTHAESLSLFNQPVREVCSRDLLACNLDLSIRKAAGLMSRRRCSSIMVREPEGGIVGILTDNDLRKKVIAEGGSVDRPVSEIMSSPIKTIAEDALVFEALMAMMQQGIKHLGVTDRRQQVTGVVTNQDVLAAQGQSPLFLIRDVSAASGIERLEQLHQRLPKLVQGLIRSGTPAKQLNQFITAVSDAVLRKVIELVLQDMDPPPLRFVFMIMGSEGRKEQTLKTDQDNAIVYDDPSERAADAVHDYFLKLGDRVCTALDRCGYRFCNANVMARNPKLCQPLSVWKQYFTEWIHAAGPEELLYSSIFFDFRAGYGYPELLRQLRTHLQESLVGWSGFFRHLTENALLYKPPLGFFRNFVVESKGEHRNKFDIKHAMLPIVDYARVYALKYGLEETNTLERLNQLRSHEILPGKGYEEIEQGYSFLMQLRFARQVSAILEEGVPPDNYINPKELSGIEQRLLKEIFIRIGNLQTRMSFDFTGEP